MTWFQDPAHRSYVYNVMIAAGGVLVGLGILTDATVQIWSDLLAALLMIGGGALARANTPAGGNDDR